MKKLLLIIFSVTAFNLVSQGQHDHHMPKKDTIPVKKDTIRNRMDTMKKHQHDHATMDHSAMKHDTMPAMQHHQMDHGMMGGTHSFSRNLPMSRNGSGTAWNPDETPMYMWMQTKGKSTWMFHGSVFMRYTHTDVFESGSRGEGKLSFPNWFMAMMNREVGKRGLLNFNLMLSLDRLTEGGAGYPLLLQSGETWKGQRLVDRQHPHDLFSALSVGYTHMISKDADVFGYIGYPGEPALSAPAFMHRISSMNIADAPLGHHWQDATHITFGVGTLGFRYKKFKLEGSIFTGREPDENRFDFDEPLFDSYSYRLSYNPSPKWAFQFSQGFITSPEALEPDEDVTRTTASALYAKKLSADKHLTAALIWGLNNKGHGHKEHSALLEANYQAKKMAYFSRYEFIQKSPEEIALSQFSEHEIFNVHTLALGTNRILTTFKGIDFVGGVQVRLNGIDKLLQPLYGNFPVGMQVYLQFRPTLHRH